MTTNINAVKEFIVRNSDSSIDHEKSQAEFAAALLKYESERETELETIANAVHAIFDKFRGTRLNMPSIWTFTAPLLNAQPENEKILKEKTLQYVRDNAPDPNSKMKPGEAKLAGFQFHIGKGKNSSVQRLCDFEEEEKK